MRSWLGLTVLVVGTLGAMIWVAAPGNSAGGGPIANGADLQREIAAARPGAVLLLQPGKYGYVELRHSEGITLKSADPDNPAVIGSLAVKAGRDLVFENLLFDYEFSLDDVPNARQLMNWPFTIFDAQNVTVRNSTFDGDILADGRAEEIGYPTGTGLYIRGCDGCTVENSIVYGFVRGLLLDRSANTVIRNNDIFGIRMDGMNLVAMSTVLIEGNHIHDFVRALSSGDHSDMIQFWTAGSKVPSTNVTIRGNVINSGREYYSQSIFMRNELVDTGKAGPEMHYRNLLIEDNVIINAHLHGITVGEADGLVVRNNTLIHNRLSDGPENNPGLWNPVIYVKENALNVVIENNIAPQIDTADVPATWRISRNLGVQDRNPGAPGWYDKVFANAISGDPSDLRNYGYLGNGPAGGGGVGAPGLAPANIEAFARKFANREPVWATVTSQPLSARKSMGDSVKVAPAVVEQPVVAAKTEAAASEPMTVSGFAIVRDPQFDNRFTFTAEAEAAEMEWSIEGAKASGKTVRHDFQNPGPQEVVLILRQADGRTTEARATVDVPHRVQLEWDGAAGKMLGQTAEGLGPVWEPTLTEGEGGAKAFVVGPDAVAMPPGVMPGFFGAGDFVLSLRFKTVNGAGAVGEILQIHQALGLSITPIGAAELQIAADSGRPIRVKTGPLRLHDGAWHGLEVRYDSTAGEVGLWVDGSLKAAAALEGLTPPKRSWGMSFGNQFGQTSFNGAISALQLRSNEARFAR